MKSLKNLIITLALLGFVFAFNSCNQDDDIAPTIYFIESQDTTVLLQTLFDDPGIYVEDNKDLNSEIEIESDFYDELSFNIADSTLRVTGDYEITYTATDLAGNEKEGIRTVSVINVASTLAGSYNVVGVYENVPNRNFTSSISADARCSGKIRLTKTYMHTIGDDDIYLKIEAWLYSDDHSLDITNSSVEVNEHFGWMATPDNPDEPFFFNMYAETALSMMPRYKYLHIPTQTFSDSVNAAAYQIKGQTEDNGMPRSYITYDVDQITEIVIKATVTRGGSVEEITETYVPR
ncbi:MAG: DUF5011 domain-containing protein [Bacteroidota bacterium]|nr:DUF5011 domain-containing protein [Bacteroidota bacterium]